MTETRTIQDLMREAPGLAAPVDILIAAGARFAPVVESLGPFSKVDLSSVMTEAIDMYVGYRATTPPEARILIRESFFGANRIVADKTAAGWRVATDCDKEAKPWFVALVHLIFKITPQDCVKQEGRDHRNRHDVVVAGIDEIISGFIGTLAAPVASAR